MVKFLTNWPMGKQ